MRASGDYPIGGDAFLSVRLAAGSDGAERILLVGRPDDGLVHVREWSTHSWNTAGDDFDMDASELLAQIEGVYASGLGVMPEMYEIRRWLEG